MNWEQIVNRSICDLFFSKLNFPTKIMKTKKQQASLLHTTCPMTSLFLSDELFSSSFEKKSSNLKTKEIQKLKEELKENKTTITTPHVKNELKQLVQIGKKLYYLYIEKEKKEKNIVHWYDYASGQEVFYQEYNVTFQLEGFTIGWYTNGQVRCFLQYSSNNKRKGIWVRWNEQGSLQYYTDFNYNVNSDVTVVNKEKNIENLQKKLIDSFTTSFQPVVEIEKKVLYNYKWNEEKEIYWVECLIQSPFYVPIWKREYKANKMDKVDNLTSSNSSSICFEEEEFLKKHQNKEFALHKNTRWSWWTSQSCFSVVQLFDSKNEKHIETKSYFTQRNQTFLHGKQWSKSNNDKTEYYFLNLKQSDSSSSVLNLDLASSITFKPS
jgi:hypothetical protein